jgi:hypothetical protein
VVVADSKLGVQESHDCSAILTDRLEAEMDPLSLEVRVSQETSNGSNQARGLLGPGAKHTGAGGWLFLDGTQESL